MQLLSDADLAAQRCARNGKLAQLHAKHAALGERIATEMATLEAIEQELRRRNLTAAQAAAQGVDWADTLMDGKGVLHHKERERVLQALGLASAGFFPETLQRCICIMMQLGNPGEVEALAGSLDVVLPHVLPVDGWCAIRVLEHSPSGDGYHLRFPPDRSEYQVVNLRLRTPEVELATPDLREALTHIQRHHFFDAAPRGR
jgi:hypothetical protein